MPRCRRAGLAADEKKPAWEAGFVPSAIAFLRLAGRTESVARSALRRDDDRRARHVGDTSAECAHHARCREQRNNPFLHIVLPLSRKGPCGPFVVAAERQNVKLTFDWLVVALTFVACVAPDAASASIVY